MLIFTGVDAQIALQFHEAREANPQKFNSRIRNKMFYGQAGGKDLLLRKWKDLSDNIKVECDGQDITPKLKEHRVHSVLFANIPSFGSGKKSHTRLHVTLVTVGKWVERNFFDIKSKSEWLKSEFIELFRKERHHCCFEFVLMYLKCAKPF